MTADVTIHISIGSAEATVSQTTAATGPPAPMSLDQIQTTVAATAPAPQALEQLTTGDRGDGNGTAPPPMPIEQLQMAAVATAAPEPFGALTNTVGAPPPEVMQAFAATNSAPEPLPLNEIGEPTTEQSGADDTGRRPGRREKKET